MILPKIVGLLNKNATFNISALIRGKNVDIHICKFAMDCLLYTYIVHLSEWNRNTN